MSRFLHARRGGWSIAPSLMAAAALVVAGCGGGGRHSNAGEATAASPAAAKPVGAPGATVRFLAPQAGTTVTGSTVHVRVRVSGFTLDPRATGQAARQGFGHLSFALDGRRSLRSAAPTITFRHVRPGRHTLVVYLVNNDQSPTGVSARVTFTVRRPPPPPPPAPATTSTSTQTATPTHMQAAPSTDTQPAPMPQSTPGPAPAPEPSSGGSGTPRAGAGDGDADNSGGPDDGDGNQ